MVATESLLVIAGEVVQTPNDKQQIAPMLDMRSRCLAGRPRPARDTVGRHGYFSEANVTLCAAANIAPLIALGRQPHHRSLRERFAAPPPSGNPTPAETMAYRLRTPTGKSGLDQVRGSIQVGGNVKRASV